MRTWFAITLSALTFGAHIASADDAPPAASTTPAAAAPAPDPSTVTDQFTLPKGGIVIDAFLEVNLSSISSGGDSVSLVGKPISISPDIWYGVTDDITVGLVHSTLGQTGLLGEVGDSLCLTGSSNGCASIYNDVGADVRYRLMAPFTFDGGLFITSTSPNVDLALKVGIDGRWRFGKIAVEAQPSLFIDLNNRNGDNTEALIVPVTASYPVTPAISVALQLGLVLPFSDTGDEYEVPLSIAARYAVNPKLSVGLDFSLLAILGGSDVDTGADLRTITLGGSYAL